MIVVKYLHQAWARLMYLAMGKTLADNTPVPILSVRLLIDQWWMKDKVVMQLTLHASLQEVGLVPNLSGIGRAPPGIGIGNVFEKQN